MTDFVRFKRAALIIADLDRSLALYRDALGFTLQSIKESPTDSYSYEIFSVPADARVRMAALDGPPDQGRTLALIEVTPALAGGPGPRASTVVQVADLSATIARLRGVPGLRLFAERELKTHDGKIGREVGIIDPDGHAVVVYQI